jgi:predicted nucleotidyltransferase component of viral defense system
MNQAVMEMLERYDCHGVSDYENALREIFQELILLGLWRGKFFEKAAFYGGTALRVIYGLDRFSEDMDFSLLQVDSEFTLDPYCEYISKELEAWGFPVDVAVKPKSDDTAIESAFLKADTEQQLLVIDAPASVVGSICSGRRFKIKIEVDTTPPLDFKTESQFLLRPIPFSVRVYKTSDLFAGKMHALLFRNWKNRVKGRDWYDFIWYVSHEKPLSLEHLTARMRQTGLWKSKDVISEKELRALLSEKIKNLDINSALEDVKLFVRDKCALDVWSKDFFEHVMERMVVI